MWEDFYNEGPSDFDITIEEFKEELRKNVRDEYVKEMTRLKKENEELQDVRKNWAQIQMEYRLKEEKFNRETSDIKRELARKRIDELTTIADFSEHIYVIDYKDGRVPKCDKCDDNRQIHFTSPSGRDFREDCPVCGKRYCIYYPKPVDAIKIRFSKDTPFKSEVWAIKHEAYGDSVIYKKENVWKGTVEEFNIDDYHTVRHTCFESKELAQKICDRINKKNNVPDNVGIEE